MRIKDKTMIHIHRNGIHDDVWHEGNEFIVDNNFNSNFTSNFDISTGLKVDNNQIVPLDHLLQGVIDFIDSKEDMLNFKYLTDEEFMRKCDAFKVILNS